MAQFLSRFDVTPIQNLAAKDGEIVLCMESSGLTLHSGSSRNGA
jgi:hypothetical protein